MPYTPERIAQLESILPPAGETRQRVKDYLTRSDMSMPQFAKIAGYSSAAVRNFVMDRYTRYCNIKTDAVIRQALEEAMDRHPVGLPDTDAEGTLYETENVADLRQWFLHCHEHRALAFCYGPPGSQKTFVLKHLVAEFNRRELQRTDTANRAFYVRSSVRMQPRDLLMKLCAAAGATAGFSLQRCMGGLRQQLRATKTLFVIDEGQHLSIDCLEALRELHDEDPQIGALLAGSHTLKLLFDRRSAELEQWNSRLDAGIELTGVSLERAAVIVRTELPSLSEKQVRKLVEGALVPDAYSTANKSYFNVRRLFKQMEAIRRATPQPKKELPN